MDETTSDGRGITCGLVAPQRSNGRSTTPSPVSAALMVYVDFSLHAPFLSLSSMDPTRHLTSGVACGRTIKSLMSYARGVVVIRDASRDGESALPFQHVLCKTSD
jgi:hypothetical protein